MNIEKKSNKELMKEQLRAKKTENTFVAHPLLPFQSIKTAVLCLFFLACTLYANTVLNDYALDDGLVIGENKYVLSGLKGIPNLLQYDSFQAFYEANGSSKSELQGGRWRPLSLITFAIEVQLFGKSPSISHAINVLLYALLVCQLFYFLSLYFFKEQWWIAFLAAALFCLHPIHTESVANIKSRDELLSLLFIVLFFNQYYQYLQHETKKNLSKALVWLGLALLSKENGVTLIAIAPLTFYFAFPYTLAQSIRKSVPAFGLLFLYLAVRFAVVGGNSPEFVNEVLNNPYAFATTSQRWASIITLPLYYFKLLFFPYPLSYDYSYNQLPYQSLTSPLLYISLGCCMLLLGYALAHTKSKKITSYAILFFFLSYSIVSNIVIDLGATMGERLIFQASLGFCLLLAIAINWLINQNKIPINVFKFSLLTLGIIAAAATIHRNTIWKNNDLLFTNDVMHCPNSAKTNNAASTAYVSMFDRESNKEIKKTYIDKALFHLEQSEKIHPNFADIHMNRGAVLWRVGKYTDSEAAWNRGRELNPNHNKLREYDTILCQYYMGEGIKKGQAKNYDAAIADLQKATEYGKNNAEAWYNLGGVAFMKGDAATAKNAFELCLRIDPQHPKARQGLASVEGNSIKAK